jgi:hypothetical protein
MGILFIPPVRNEQRLIKVGVEALWFAECAVGNGQESEWGRRHSDRGRWRLKEPQVAWVALLPLFFGVYDREL